MKRFFTAIAAGMVLVYFLEPRNGASRRTAVMGRMSGMTGMLPGSAGKMAGMMPHRHDNTNPDDPTLKDRVESEVLRDPKFGHAPINFNVENGVVVIHGELPDQGEIDELVSKVRSIRDVKGVENLLHLPGTPAPNKLSAIEAS